MQISLRRAGALQEDIKEALKALDLSPTANISVFAEVDVVTQSAENKLVASIGLATDLLEALFDIREKTALTNTSAGVTTLLTKMAKASMRIEFLQPLADARPHEPSDITEKRAERLQNRDEPSSHYGATSGPVETLPVHLLTPDVIAKHASTVREIKKEKRRIKDEIAEINATTKFALSDKSIETLTVAQLL